MEQKPLVAIRCMTYNHAPYIEDAMRGFCMQQTSFPFVAIIVDDASTDGEPEVILKYLDAHFDMPNARRWETADALFVEARHKENQNCWFAVVLLKYNFWQAKKNKNPLVDEWLDTAEYIALCEGDDYWIVEDKLQKQVDFLERHEEYSLVYTDYNELDVKSNPPKWTCSLFKAGKKPIITSFEEHLLNKAYIAPMSWLYRKEFAYVSKNYKGKNSIDGSFIFILELLLVSRIFFMDETTSVYRVHWGSATNQTSATARRGYSDGVYHTQMYYLDRYNLSAKYPNCCDYYYRANYCYFLANNVEEMYPHLESFFKREGVASQKFRIFHTLMQTRIGVLILRSVCKMRMAKTGLSQVARILHL